MSDLLKYKYQELKDLKIKENRIVNNKNDPDK